MSNIDYDDCMTDTQSITFEVCVTPHFDNLTPRYDAVIYRNVEGGVCGPFAEVNDLVSLDAVNNWVGAQGFTRKRSYGNVCANGFASAPIGVTPSRYAHEDDQ